jgi:hypothetical protein
LLSYVVPALLPVEISELRKVVPLNIDSMRFGARDAARAFAG